MSLCAMTSIITQFEIMRYMCQEFRPIKICILKNPDFSNQVFIKVIIQTVFRIYILGHETPENHKYKI